MKTKKTFPSAKWLRMFVLTLLAVAMLVPALNFVVDPYGAFGDRFFQWWSYDETLNPRLAKMRYLNQHWDEYDSYIVGSSGSSSFPVEDLNRYYNASFYNCMFYGTEMETFEKTCRYLVTHDEVKNLFLVLSPRVARSYYESEDDLTTYSWYPVSGGSALKYYLTYLFNTPLDCFKKIETYKNDGYLQTPYKVFNEQTGAYDKSVRDVEAIHELDEYTSRKAYSVFRNYPKNDFSIDHLDLAVASVGRISELCAEKHVNLVIVCLTLYTDYTAYYTRDELDSFFNGLATVTDYWDFSYNSISFDPRYFYDKSHMRNAVGHMILGEMFSDPEVWRPENLGRYVKRGEQPGAMQGVALPEADYTARVPILRYHNLTEGVPKNNDTVSAARFREQMLALKAAGCTPVDIWQMRDYVEKGTPLPEKPVLITFDDGYISNYTLAYPILRELGFKATIFAIGVSIGKDTYKDTGVAMTPHFSLEQAREMTESGLITVASHGYNVHEVAGRDAEPIRPGALMREGETEAAYVSFLTQDARTMFDLLGESAGFFSYPQNRHDTRCLVVLNRAGVFATVSGDGAAALLVRGLPQSLFDMPRNFVSEQTTGEDLIAMLQWE